MLINLTNHPVKGVFNPEKKEYQNAWSLEQINAAIELFDEIVELPFPKIPANWSTFEVKTLAQEYCNRCIAIMKSPSLRNAVHIGGETMFCYYFITLLMKEGYQVISSTSERDVEELEENSSIKKFKFVRFRQYISI